MTQVTLGGKKKKNSPGCMPRTPLEAYAFDARFGKRSVFILDPRLLAICWAKAVSSFLSYFRPGVSVRSGESITRDLLLSSQALYRLSYSCRGLKEKKTRKENRKKKKTEQK